MKRLKKCSLCGQLKPLSEFYRQSETQDGFQYWCRECVRERAKGYYKKHKEQINERSAIWYIHNKEKKAVARKKYDALHRREHRESLRLRRLTDPKTRVDSLALSTIYRGLKYKKAPRRWHRLFSFTLEALLSHMETRFDKNMSWDNYGSYWWLDHIKPRVLFHYASPYDKEFKECWSLDNLQPLEANENLSKGAKYPQ